MRMSTLSGRFSKAARSEVISPILVRVGTEEVGRVDDGDAVHRVVVDDVAGLDVGVERAGLGHRRGQLGDVLDAGVPSQDNVVGRVARKSCDTWLSLMVALKVWSPAVIVTAVS